MPVLIEELSSTSDSPISSNNIQIESIKDESENEQPSEELDEAEKKALRKSTYTGPRMTKEFLKKHCKEQKLYITPYLNDVLYLHFKGFSFIENLEEYTGLKCLWLESNGLEEISNLTCQTELKCLYVQQNLIKKIENLEPLKLLDTINLSNNFITKIENLSCCPLINSLIISRNKLEKSADLEHLVDCENMSCVDVSHNIIDDPDILDNVFAKMKNLRVLNLMGNPVIRMIRDYRKMFTIKIKQLTYLDDRPVFPRDRACAEAWGIGGVEAEKEERIKWNNAEHKRIMDSVNGLLQRRERYISEHAQTNSNENSTAESAELVDVNMFEHEEAAGNLTSDDLIGETNNEKRQDDLDSDEDSDGFIEVKINKNLCEKESIFSNKIDDNKNFLRSSELMMTEINENGDTTTTTTPVVQEFDASKISEIPDLETIPSKPLIEMLSNDDTKEDRDFLDVSKILPKSDTKNDDVFKNFDKIESEFDTLD